MRKKCPTRPNGHTMRDRKTRKRAANMSTTIKGEEEKVLITRNAINEVYRSFNLLIRSIDAMAIIGEVTCGIYVLVVRD